MFWIIARAMNLALTAAAIAAGIVVSGGFSKTAWAKLATNDLDLGSLSALAETNSLADGAKVILASVQPLIDRVMAYLADVKAERGTVCRRLSEPAARNDAGRGVFRKFRRACDANWDALRASLSCGSFFGFYFGNRARAEPVVRTSRSSKNLVLRPAIAVT